MVIAEETLSDSTTHWTLTDHLGTIRDVVVGNIVVEHADYDVFGIIVNGSLTPLFTYTGRGFESETGLYHYRARYYDAALHRFISRDPIGFAGGDPNINRYVGNGPSNATDPSGLKKAVYVEAEGYKKLLPGNQTLTWVLDALEIQKIEELDATIAAAQQAYLCGDGDTEALDAIVWAIRYKMAIINWDPLSDPLFVAESLGGRPANGITYTFDFEMYETGKPGPDRAFREKLVPIWKALGFSVSRALTPSGKISENLGGRSGKSGRNTSESHTPGRGHNSKSAGGKRKAFQKKAAQKRAAAEQCYEDAKKVWEGLTVEQRKMLPDLNPEKFKP